MQVYRPSNTVVDTTNLIEMAVGSPVKAKLWMGTQAEYDAIVNKDNETAYFIVDGNPLD